MTLLGLLEGTIAEHTSKTLQKSCLSHSDLVVPVLHSGIPYITALNFLESSPVGIAVVPVTVDKMSFEPSGVIAIFLIDQVKNFTFAG